MKTLNRSMNPFITLGLVLSIGQIALAEDSATGVMDSSIDTEAHNFSLDTAASHNIDLDFDTIDVEQELHEEMLDEHLSIHSRKRYRVPNLLRNDHMRISLKGNITVHVLGYKLRKSLGMENSSLYFKLRDRGDVAHLIFKQRF